MRRLRVIAVYTWTLSCEAVTGKHSNNKCYEQAKHKCYEQAKHLTARRRVVMDVNIKRLFLFIIKKRNCDVLQRM